MRIPFLIAIFVVAHFNVQAQKFVAEASLPPLNADGFYRIPLVPGMAKYLSTDYANVRIINSSGEEVPYVLGSDEMRSGGAQFLQYVIEEKTVLKDSCTVIVLSNADKSVISNINLVIKNAEVVKQATLAGSDDKQTWYALKDSFSMGYINNPNGTSQIQIVDFPNSNYRFYRILIDDKKSDPLNVLQAGYYVSFKEDAKYTPVPMPTIRQKNEADRKTSSISIQFDTTYIIDKLRWKISGPPFYLREANLYTLRQRLNKKGKAETYREYLAAIQLNSRQENVMFLNTTKTDNLLLEVVNDDNPPLDVNGLEAFQLGRHVTAWLKKDEKHLIKFGDADLRSPVYDLEFFRDSIPTNPMIINAGELTEISEQTVSSSESFFTSRTFIWGAIAVIIAFLAFMSLKMIRETNATQKEGNA